MNWAIRRKAFRKQFKSNICVYPGSVFDPVSARIARDLGFEIGMFAGSVASLTVLGEPDHIVLTLSEFAQQAYRISRASDLPIMVDADHGYGNALNVKRTVEELETAGVSGLSIEDTVLPRPFGSGGKVELISLAEGVGKMKAAAAGRQDPLLTIAARTSAPLVTGIDDTLERISAYQDTGVDALFLIGIKSQRDLEKVAGIAKLPLILGGAGKEIMDLPYLGSMGVRLCLQGHQPIMASIQATYNTLSALKKGISPSELEGVADESLVSKFDGSQDYERWIQAFLEPNP